MKKLVLFAIIVSTALLFGCVEERSARLDEQIASIGIVEIEDAELIEKCSKEYDSMSARGRKLVEYSDELKSAETQIAHLIAVDNDKQPPVISANVIIDLFLFEDVTTDDLSEFVSVLDDVSSKDSIVLTINEPRKVDYSTTSITISATDEAGNVCTKVITVKPVSRYDFSSIITYNEIAFGVRSIRNAAKSPSTVKIVGIRIYDQTTYFEFEAANSFGAIITQYAESSWDVSGIFRDRFWWPSDDLMQWSLSTIYDKATKTINLDEYSKFLDSPYADLTKDQIMELHKYLG